MRGWPRERRSVSASWRSISSKRSLASFSFCSFRWRGVAAVASMGRTNRQDGNREKIALTKAGSSEITSHLFSFSSSKRAAHDERTRLSSASTKSAVPPRATSSKYHAENGHVGLDDALLTARAKMSGPIGSPCCTIREDSSLCDP